MTAAVIFGALACLSVALILWQFLCAMRFPLHRRIVNPTFAPNITILKPLKGADIHTRKCLQSWITQSYGGKVQILFGVHSPDDPVCALVRDLIEAHPHVDAELVICPKLLGPNAKVSTLIHLQPLAKHHLIAISDADVLVPADFLAQIVAPLERPEVGLVNCFYELKCSPPNLNTPTNHNPTLTPPPVPSCSISARWEAFVVNSDFWSQVLQARSLKPIDFALGAVMITTAQRLRAIGAFDSLLDYLADDYQLGNRIARDGGKIVLSPVVVESWSPPMTAGEIWRHQLRWARTIRVSQPAAWFFSLLNDVTLWTLLWLATQSAILPIAAAFVAVRIVTAFLIERKLTGRLDFSSPPCAIIADLARPILWALSFLGNTVTWRGEKYRVLRGGKLVP